MNTPLPTTTQAKSQAKALRIQLAAQGTEIGHAQALERVAQQYGFADWNTLSAIIANRPPTEWRIGARVRGAYLSQDFTGTVVTIDAQRPGWFGVELDLDQPVDVVTFDSFSNFRKRIRGTVGPQGTSQERTSDGVPHLTLHL